MPYFNVTNTAKFLSCTSSALAPVLHHVTKTTPAPVVQTQYTTVYETVLPAACETGQWMATYTVTETCTGTPSEYTPKVIPPGFVVTTVSCPICQPATTVEITCPGVQPTGYPTVGITGNGVTATITATPNAYPMGRPGAYPTKVPGHSVPAGPGSCFGHDSCPEAGPKPVPIPCAGPGCPIPEGPGPVVSCHGPECPRPDFEFTPGGNPGSPPCYGPECHSKGPVPVPCPGPGCPSSGNNNNNTITTMNPPSYAVSAGASSFTNALALVKGLVFVAGHFVLL
ncbi:hypothetical protein F5Y11DRAFT_332647 [Daldinia sp. FL1419]|nr:hypothetical protein F5Y11DRAFT_332647 [Daldinia sp. FL1419]